MKNSHVTVDRILELLKAKNVWYESFLSTRSLQLAKKLQKLVQSII